MSRRSSSATDPSVDPDARQRQRGIALAALLASITIMLIGLGIAATGWNHIVQDNDEQELLFRGMQIVKGLQRMQRPPLGRRPATLEETVKVKMLRKEYLDPMTSRDPKLKGKWRFIHDGNLLDLQNCGMPGGPAVTPPQPGAFLSAPAGLLAHFFSVSFLPTAQASDEGYVRMAQGLEQSQGSGMGANSGSGAESGGGPIIGVRSRSDRQSIRVFWGKNHYKDWCFTEKTVPDWMFTVAQMTYPTGMPKPDFEAVPQTQNPLPERQP